jgi:tetratricopeptide (TPR) repeat protein
MTDPSHDDIDFMEGYLQGTLSSEERKDFEERLRNDPEFQKEFDSFRLSYSAIILESRKEVKQRLQQEDAGASAPKGRVVNWRYVSIGIAASIVLAVLLVQIYRSPSPDKLYLSYHETYPNVVAPIERNETTVDSYKKAFQLYEQKEYSNALEQFRVILKDSATSSSVNLYAGLCALELNDPTTAVSYFEAVIASSPNDFSETAKWYAALAYLKAGNKEKAIFYLDQLKDDSFYHARARDLMKELE